MLLDHLDELRNQETRQTNTLELEAKISLEKPPERYQRPKRGFIYSLIHPLDFIGWDHFHQFMRDGHELMKQENYLDAAGAFNLALLERKTSVQAILGLVQALEGLGGVINAHLAKDYLQKALKLDFKNLDIYEELIYISEKLGEKSDALEHRRRRFTVRTLQSQPNNPMILNNIGVMLLELDQHQRAIQYFQKAVIESPHMYLACFNMAKAWFKRGMQVDGKKAQHHCLQSAVDALDEGRVDDPPGMLLRGKILLKLKKYGEAKEILHEAMYRAPAMKEIHATMQLVNEKLGNIQDAMSNFNTYELLKKDVKKKKGNRFGFLKNLKGGD